MSNPQFFSSSEGDRMQPAASPLGRPAVDGQLRPPSGWLRWPVLLIACLFAAAGGAATTWFVLHKPNLSKPAENEDEEDEEDDEGYDEDFDDGGD
jgi:hypothetical protein